MSITPTRSGVEVGLFFKEMKPDEVKISWRSKASVDVSRLAAHLGAADICGRWLFGEGFVIGGDGGGAFLLRNYFEENSAGTD